MHKRSLLGILLVVAMVPCGGILCWGQSASAAPSALATAQCKALESADFSSIQDAPTQIIGAKVVGAKGREPAFCQARGYIWPQVGFELRLPVSNWNGKFIEIGCGGSCGNLNWTFWCPTKRGYACMVSDMGHEGGGHGDQDMLWAADNLQAQLDFGYRGPHVAALAGKAITKHYYREAPRYSYFWGISDGGGQALMEAERFPWDFNGIIAGAPFINYSDGTAFFVWAYRALTGADGKLILSHADLQLVHNLVLAKCDMDDGVKDGVIGDPPACRFDLSELLCKAGEKAGCLTTRQVNAVKKVYAGPSTSKGKRIFPGAEPGSELWWLYAYTGSDRAYARKKGGLCCRDWDWTLQYFRFMVIPPMGPNWQMSDYNFDTDYKRFDSGVQEAILDADNPDLRKFKAADGKLIMYQGWNDQDVPPEGTIDFYKVVERTMGGRAATQDFFRLFMVPGMRHGSGGAGAYAIDYLKYMKDWVEDGQAPDVMIGAHVPGLGWGQALGLKFPLAPGTPISFTRPVYPYPLRAVYKGTGDPNKAENFKAVGP